MAKKSTARVSTTKTPAKVAKTDAVKRKAEPTAPKKAKFTTLKSKIFHSKTKGKATSKLTKKAQKEAKIARRNTIIRGIIGIGLLLTVVSIARSTFIALQFVDGTANVIYLLPQIIFAAIVSITVFILAILNLHK